MLIHSHRGYVFHIVTRKVRGYYECLCGVRIRLNHEPSQISGEGMYYERCADCHRLDLERLRRSPNLKVYTC